MPRYRHPRVLFQTRFSSILISILITLDPEFFHAAFHDSRLESDAAREKDDEAEEEDFPGVALDADAQTEQLLLELGTEPEGSLVSRRFALE